MFSGAVREISVVFPPSSAVICVEDNLSVIIMHFGQRHVRTDAQKGKMADGEAVINLKKLKVL